ncbi:Unannotated [Lentimonas sp. CC4]|nr:Unannotated [Lentimonas sp. CC4]CAA6686754.1 Unannotated [Lentimonas sp. CC6]CAA7075668.1 Unannotated [Lentimonas sp. CC4]CAA7168173.1 Unannotated [Lentimonas sp. CC21]CAA7181675.1 Unannotated [Lentimonas sp. CC8]
MTLLAWCVARGVFRMSAIDVFGLLLVNRAAYQMLNFITFS